MRIEVDGHRCMGHAMCAAVAGDVYKIDDLGYNVTPDVTVSGDLEAQAREGAQACPEAAIRITEQVD